MRQAKLDAYLRLAACMFQHKEYLGIRERSAVAEEKMVANETRTCTGQPGLSIGGLDDGLQPKKYNTETAP